MLHGFNKTVLPDVDVIYFDDENIAECEDEKLEEKLKSISPNIPWSVKNQARMHIINDFPPYSSSVDEMSKFPETATALGLKLDHENQVILTAPHGIQDAVNLQVKPTPHFSESNKGSAIYKKRIMKKDWKSKWNKIEINHLREVTKRMRRGIRR